MSHTYDPERIARLAEISCKFTAHAAVGDEILLGIDGDEMMPAKYRGSSRPSGTIIKIKNEGMENATLRVQMDTGKIVDLPPFNVDGAKVWEFKDSSWEKVLARNGMGAAGDSKYKGSSGGTSSNDDVVALRQQMSQMTQRFDEKMAQSEQFNHALVESIAQITGEVAQANPSAKFSRVFQQEYKGMSKNQEASPFDSDIEDDDF